jgi:hypothetical protein
MHRRHIEHSASDNADTVLAVFQTPMKTIKIGSNCEIYALKGQYLIKTMNIIDV